jgi:hypothetical protein
MNPFITTGTSAVPGLKTTVNESIDTPFAVWLLTRAIAAGGAFDSRASNPNLEKSRSYTPAWVAFASSLTETRP